MNDLFDLSEKVAVVAGGGGLLGSLLSRTLAEFNAEVIVADNDAMALERVNDSSAGEAASSMTALQMDISDEKSVRQALDQIVRRFNKVDILVNSAYPRTSEWGAPFETVTVPSWLENVQIHLGGYFITSRCFSEQMIAQGSGNIINVASIYGIVAPDFQIYEGTNMTNPSEYAAIKAGIIGLTRYLASYFARHNIRVNCISPGGIFNDQPEAFVERYRERTPLGRMAKPDDFAGGLVYLASDASSYVTGHNLVIDGGWSII